MDYSPEFDRLGFQAFGVGFCGVTDQDGRVIRPGDFDAAHNHRRAHPSNPGFIKPPLALVKLFKLLDRHPDLLNEVRAA
jgi:hypothetical protein